MKDGNSENKMKDVSCRLCVLFVCCGEGCVGGGDGQAGRKGRDNGGGKTVNDVGGREGAGDGTGRGRGGGVDEGRQQHEKWRVWRT
jgi:hypothetical protein